MTFAVAAFVAVFVVVVVAAAAATWFDGEAWCTCT